MKPRRTQSFGVFFDPGKVTSGQRFFHNLFRELSGEAVALEDRPSVVLFNVSASIRELLKAKRRGQKILLRIDGMYVDRLSQRFLDTFSWPIRTLLALGLKWRRAQDPLAFVANLLNQNYGAFARILLADRLVYQSAYSQRVHSRFFPRKPFSIVVNGAPFRGRERPVRPGSGEGATIRVVTTYDEWNPAKRVHDVVRFVQWARETKGVALELTVLGYTGRIPECVPHETRPLLEHTPYIRTLPRFTQYDGAVSDALFASDLYLTFTHRDSCPNVVIEAMAHGLPVVGVESGGMPDIVGEAGVLVPTDNAADSFYTSYRHECDFPKVDFEGVLAGILTVSSRREVFEARVAARFETVLGIGVAAERYAAILRTMAKDCTAT